MSLLFPSLNFRAASSRSSLQYGALMCGPDPPLLFSASECWMRLWKESSFAESLALSLLSFELWGLLLLGKECPKLLFGGEKAEHSFGPTWETLGGLGSGRWRTDESCRAAARDPSSLAVRAAAVASCSGSWLSAGIALGSHTAPGFMFCTAVALNRHCW